jgi:hypothetical protein
MKRAPCIHELRPTRAIDQELEWFFNRAESDMGLRSNFLASIGVHTSGYALHEPRSSAHPSEAPGCGA